MSRAMSAFAKITLALVNDDSETETVRVRGNIIPNQDIKLDEQKNAKVYQGLNPIPLLTT